MPAYSVRHVPHDWVVSSDLTIAIVGGLAGSAFTAVLAFGGRVASVPDETKRHDRMARAYREDLERFLRDAHRRLAGELAGITSVANKEGLLHSGPHADRLARAKTEALRALRGRLAIYQRELAEMQAAESWLHDLWRRARRRGVLEAVEPDWIADLRDQWAREVDVFGFSATVLDPSVESAPELEPLPDRLPSE